MEKWFTKIKSLFLPLGGCFITQNAGLLIVLFFPIMAGRYQGFQYSCCVGWAWVGGGGKGAAFFCSSMGGGQEGFFMSDEYGGMGKGPFFFPFFVVDFSFGGWGCMGFIYLFFLLRCGPTTEGRVHFLCCFFCLCRLWHNEGADHMCHKHIEKPLFDIMVFFKI